MLLNTDHEYILLHMKNSRICILVLDMQYIQVIYSTLLKTKV